MRLLKVAAAALNQTPLDWAGNRRRIAEAIAAARSRDVAVLCLPELSVTGYGCEDAFLAAWTREAALEVLGDLLPETRGIAVTFGLPLMFRNALYNVAALAVDGELAGFVPKQNLAGDGVHYEPRWFRPWPAGARAEQPFAGRSVPVGDLLFELGDVRVGLEICEDAWSADRPAASLARQGADLILNPSASHFAFGKQAVRRALVAEASRAFGVTYVHANLLGNEAGRIVYDGELLVASNGRLLAAGGAFDYRETNVLDQVVDLDLNRQSRARLASHQPRVETPAVPVEFAPPSAEPCGDGPGVAPMADRFQTFSAAVSLGLFDYMRKSATSGYVVSLSGGADSAAVVLLVREAVERALATLGAPGVRRALAHVSGLETAGSTASVTRRLLTTVYQATANSSGETRASARALAEAAGTRHLEWDVEPLVQAYTGLASDALDRTFDWTHDDTALQNIQARVRAPGAWMLANALDALLLVTSNRSEIGVGYATMDGDTSGGLAPLAGVDKPFVLEWLEWMRARHATGPIAAALGRVLATGATAELRPPARDQRDETDLMPFAVLDAVERAAVRDRRSPSEVLRVLVPAFPRYSPTELRAWVGRYFRLWARNQWKRERLAVSFHLDDENLDPRSWCRFPVLSGGFQRELQALEAGEEVQA